MKIIQDKCSKCDADLNSSIEKTTILCHDGEYKLCKSCCGFWEKVRNFFKIKDFLDPYVYKNEKIPFTEVDRNILKTLEFHKREEKFFHMKEALDHDHIKLEKDNSQP